MSTLEKAQEAMQAKFDPSAAAGLDLVFGFRIDDTKNFSLVVKDKTCELLQGERTRVRDLRLVCPNCHRLVHSKRPWLTWSELLARVQPA